MPEPCGGAFYDQPGVLDRYTSTSATVSDANAVMEEPALLAELGDVTGARVLDLGCGDAAIAPWLLARGAAWYLGVDASARMLRRARQNLTRPRAQVAQADIARFTAAAGSVDLVVSRLALHYVEDVAAVFERCRSWLVPGGTVVVTVLHPVITSHDARSSSDELRTSWVVDDYFVPGPRPQQWLGGSVTFHHRTVEQYVAALGAAGLVLDALRECEPRWSAFEGDEGEYRRRRRIPLFLLLRASSRP